MRLPIDISEELVHGARECADAEEATVDEWIAACIAAGLNASPYREASGARRSELPVIQALTGVQVPALTNAEIEEIFTQEDVERARRL